MDKQRPDGLYLPTGALVRDNAKRIADFALKSRLPSVYPYSEAVDAGGLMSYSADLTEQLSAGRLLRRQNPKGSQARLTCRSSSRRSLSW